MLDFDHHICSSCLPAATPRLRRRTRLERAVHQRAGLLFSPALPEEDAVGIDTGGEAKWPLASERRGAPGQARARPSNPTSLRLESFIALEALNGALAAALQSHSSRRKQQKNNGAAG